MNDKQVDGAFPSAFVPCPECGDPMPVGAALCAACAARAASPEGLGARARRALGFVLDLPETKFGKWLAILGIGTAAALLSVADWLNFRARPDLLVTASDCDSQGLNLHVANRGARDARIVVVEVARRGGALDDDQGLDEEPLPLKVDRGAEIDKRLNRSFAFASPVRGHLCTDSVRVGYTWTPIGVQRLLRLPGSAGDPLTLGSVRCLCEPD